MAPAAAAILFEAEDENLDEPFFVLQKQVSVRASPPIGLRMPIFDERLLLIFAT